MIETLEPLIKNATLLLLFVFIYDVFSKKNKMNKVITYQFLIGAIVAIIDLIIMQSSLNLKHIAHINCSLILIALCGLFFGWISTITALVMILIYQQLLNSSHLLNLFFLLTIASTIGLLYRYYFISKIPKYASLYFYSLGLILTFLIIMDSTLFVHHVPLGSHLIIISFCLYPLLTAIIGLLLLKIYVRESAYDALTQDTLLFQSQFNSKSIGLALIRPDGTWLEVNNYILDLLDYTKEELKNVTWYELCPDDLFSQSDTLFQQMFNGTIDNYEACKSFLKKDGSPTLVHLAVACQRHAQKITRIIVGILDLSEQIKDEEALKNNSLEIEKISNAVNLGVWNFDVGQNLVHSNYQCTHFLTSNPTAGTATHTSAQWIKALHKKDRSIFRAQLANLYSGQSNEFTGDYRLYRDDHQMFWLLIVVNVVQRDDNGVPIRTCGILLDITERKRQEESLTIAASVYTYSKEAMVIADNTGKIVAVNHSFKQICGYSESELLQKSVLFFKNELQSTPFYQQGKKQLNETGCWQGEVQLYHKNKTSFYVWMTISTTIDKHGNLSHYIALLRDITQHKLNTEQVYQQINYDPLTKLPNRRLLIEFLTQAVYAAQRINSKLVVQFLDLDGFKEVNDTLGHDQGDLLLVEATQRLMGCLRDNDIIARLGGDEFIIVLLDINDNTFVENVSQRLLDSLRAPFFLLDQTFHISASIGVSIFPDDGNSVQELLSKADQAMYIAKGDGKDCFRFFTAQMNEKIHTRMKLIQELRLAIVQEDFELYYQPILNLETNQLVQVEALVRWNHATLGVIPTAQFIKLAEETHLIITLGDWIFKKAMDQIKQWQQQYGFWLPISINMSPIQFRNHDDKIDFWINYLTELNMPKHTVTLEITEHLLLNEDIKFDLKLKRYRDAGFGITLDDFGTGYSSLSYIKKYDIDFIKIDQSFIKNIDKNKSDIALCEAIIALAQRLNIQVIAEGIETPTHLKLLKENHCEFGQGYLFNKPLTDTEFAQFYLESSSIDSTLKVGH